MFPGFSAYPRQHPWLCACHPWGSQNGEIPIPGLQVLSPWTHSDPGSPKLAFRDLHQITHVLGLSSSVRCDLLHAFCPLHALLVSPILICPLPSFSSLASFQVVPGQCPKLPKSFWILSLSFEAKASFANVGLLPMYSTCSLCIPVTNGNTEGVYLPFGPPGPSRGEKTPGSSPKAFSA